MDERTERNLENMKEWIALTKIHMTRVACEQKCAQIAVNAGIDLRGKDFISSSKDHMVAANNCLSMVEQYTKI
jgi:hypothetical protein